MLALRGNADHWSQKETRKVHKKRHVYIWTAEQNKNDSDMAESRTWRHEVTFLISNNSIHPLPSSIISHPFFQYSLCNYFTYIYPHAHTTSFIFLCSKLRAWWRIELHNNGSAWNSTLFNQGWKKTRWEEQKKPDEDPLQQTQLSSP